ncbi:hypothetical protein CYMTET_23445 [Cymbomonas tetramitiformis]|uniref:Uncharacterized protein n=1 Tax=Cymbomonas tetramitiformis TaxID=36881 RepID=A0AAE0FY55_9CHLO|nr:hypothetical protein CYMTET_23445 [Cymbomonas tetramitiformis]
MAEKIEEEEPCIPGEGHQAHGGDGGPPAREGYARHSLRRGGATATRQVEVHSVFVKGREKRLLQMVLQEEFGAAVRPSGCHGGDRSSYEVSTGGLGGAVAKAVLVEFFGLFWKDNLAVSEGGAWNARAALARIGVLVAADGETVWVRERLPPLRDGEGGREGGAGGALTPAGLVSGIKRLAEARLPREYCELEPEQWLILPGAMAEAAAALSAERVKVMALSRPPPGPPGQAGQDGPRGRPGQGKKEALGQGHPGRGEEEPRTGQEQSLRTRPPRTG